MIIISKVAHRVVYISLNIIIGAMVTMLVSCNSNAEPYVTTHPNDTVQIPATSEPPLDSYPVPTITSPSSIESINSYPDPVTPPPSQVGDAYPPTKATEVLGTLLMINKPITLDDTVVTGVGPPGLQVYILNITFMGEMMGAGTIEQDGTFTIHISELLVDTRIGLTADITTIDENIQPGENAVSIPQVGYFYDSYVIHK